MAIKSYSADRKKVAAKTARQHKSPQEHIQLFVPTQIRKRNGTVVDFDKTRISIVVQKALNATKEEHKENIPQEIAEAVVRDLGMSLEKDKRYIPAVEEVQDLVERELVLHKLPKTAKAYILYREEHSKLRERGELKGGVPEHVKKLVTESKQYFRNQLAEYVYYSTYSKWIPEEGRREAWKETVRRYVDFMKEKLGDKLSEKEYAEIQEYIISMKSLGSMRLLWSAGTAVRKTNVCAYNCSFIAPTQWRDFAEIAYISMCGTGVGFSVEHQNVEKLPMIERQTGEKPLAFVIPDSKEGWADAITFGLTTWSSGRDVEFDYGQIRPAGARLKTMGGRASGPASLKALLDLARQKMLARQGRRLSTLDVHDIICKIGEIVVAGGVRRSALISLSDLDDVEMREAKNGQFYLANAQRSMANNSAVYNEQPTIREFLDEWANLVKSGSGERGIFNRGSLKKQLPARRWKVFAKDFWTSGTNPCVTGETLVYVADGRGNVAIKTLAEEGKDVPVFCQTDRGGIVVRTMRNPRCTGIKQPIYRVILDDGSSIKTTSNHKFLSRDGRYKQVSELRRGDSLAIITRFEASIKDIFPKANSHSQNYWWINKGGISSYSEHRHIAEFHYNTRVPEGAVVHHRDYNARNNTPDNLKILSKQDHDMLHGKLAEGDNNPMRRAAHEWSEKKWKEYRKKHSRNNSGENNKNFSGVTDGELRQHALQLTKLLERRFSHKDWETYAQTNTIPQYFSKWRRDHLGGILGLAKWAAQELRYEHVSVDPRVVASYKKYTREGYNCEIRKHTVVILKNCEVCGKSFESDLSHREYGVCSISCGLRKKWQNHGFKTATIKKINTAHARRKEQRRELQVKMYSDLRFALHREPLKIEWMNTCRKNSISPEIARVSSPFRTYESLKEYAEMYNHKVISVEFVGYENVYNGTVDEYHNFFVGGFAGNTRKGKKKFVYLNNSQCGEIVLKSKQFCNLSEVVARAEDTEDTLLEKVRIATILGTYQASLTDFKYLSKEWKEHCEEEALLGVSITGQWDCKAVRNPATLRKMKEVAIETNRKYAARFGINPSTCITCVKPSGNGSQLFDSSSGMHPRHAKYYIRRIRVERHNPLFRMLKDAGVPVYPEVSYTTENATTFVLEFPMRAPEKAILKDDITALDQLQHWKMLKENYTEHNPSTTVSVGEGEWLNVANWVFEHWDIIGGLSFLPRSEHIYRLAPYEEITREEYESRVAAFPNIDFSKLVLYEYEDATQGAQELACVSGACEIDVPPIGVASEETIIPTP